MEEYMAVDGIVIHGMYAGGSISFARWSESDTRVYYSGTLETTMSATGVGFYSDPITAKMFRGGTLIASWTIYDYPDSSRDYGTKSISIGNNGNDYFELANNTEDVYVVYYCNYGGVEGGCDTGTPSVTVFYMPAGSLPYTSHKTPSISLSLPSGVNAWTKQGSSTSIHCEWNRNGDTHEHNILLKRGGSSGSDIYNQNSSSDSGSFNQSYTTPTTRDSRYTIWAKIKDNNDDSYNATAEYTRYVWGLPSISVSLANSNKIVAGTPNKITVNVGKLNLDTGATSTVWIEVNGATVKTWTGQSTGSTHTLTYNYTPESDGATYNVVAKVKHDSSKEINNASASFKTYVNPVVSDITGTTEFSPQDSAILSWTNNKSNIENNSEVATQQISITNSNVTDVTENNMVSIQLAPSGTYWVQSIFGSDKRCVDQLSSTLSVKLTNTNSGVYAISTKQFKVQYKPTKNVDNVVVQNQGKTIAINKYPKTNLKWTYPYNAGLAGVCSGFVIRVYSDANYTNLVSTNYLTTTYNNYITGPTYSYDLDNVQDLKLGVMNYVKITPYYEYPNTAKTKSEGSLSYTGELIKPYKYMSKPVIDYPINNTVWHNKNFRVLFSMSDDPDYNAYDTSIQNEYKYSDMEIKINNVVYAYSGKYTGKTAHPEIFSTDIDKINTNNYLKAMAINPSIISSFADANKFEIQIRVQKGNYFFTDAEMRIDIPYEDDTDDTVIRTWSPWSDKITLNKSAIIEQNLEIGMIIRAEHYQTVHNWGLRLLECYPLQTKDEKDIDRAVGNFINGSEHQEIGEYEGVYKTIRNLITGVNEWCIYDRIDVKFPVLPNFSPLEEIITSAKIGTDRYGKSGKNYMNLLTGYMNDYLK